MIFSTICCLSSHSELFKSETGTNPFLKPAMVKKVVEPASKKAAVKKASAKPKTNVKPPEEAAQDKKDMSNMLTQLKKATSAEKEKVQLLEIYQSLPRFSEEKLKLLKQWKLDKSCKWIGQYQESRALTNTTSESIQDGFATKYLDCKYFFLSWMHSFSSLLPFPGIKSLSFASFLWIVLRWQLS